MHFQRLWMSHLFVRRRCVRIVALLVGASCTLSCAKPSQSDLAYRQVVPLLDPERRLQPLGSAASDIAFDTSAFDGMPEQYAQHVSAYIDSVCSAIKAEPIQRRRYYDQQRRGDMDPVFAYPDDASPVYDRDAIVPLVMLPRPAVVKAWSASDNARALGWRTEDEALTRRGTVYGRTLAFEAGPRSDNPKWLPTAPFGAKIYSWDLYIEGPGDPLYYAKVGKIVLEPDYGSPGDILIDRSTAMHFGEIGGAKLLGELITVPAFVKNTRLWWTSIGNGSETRRGLAYALLDGNGAARWHPAAIASRPVNERVPPYVRPLICKQHQPKIKQHDELLLPVPLGWAPNRWEWNLEQNANEEWCLDDWFPAQADACWVIREAEDSQPFKESFLLMPARTPSDRPVFFIALFAETEPKQLVEELAALYQVSPDEALNSPETMERLNALYEAVRDFPLVK